MARQYMPHIEGRPKFNYRIALAGRTYTLTFHYIARLESWYFDLARGGVTLRRKIRLSPGYISTFGLVASPGLGGVFFTKGAAGYAQDDLGRQLILMFIPTADFPPVPASEDFTVRLNS